MNNSYPIGAINNLWEDRESSNPVLNLCFPWRRHKNRLESVRGKRKSCREDHDASSLLLELDDDGAYLIIIALCTPLSCCCCPGPLYEDLLDPFHHPQCHSPWFLRIHQITSHWHQHEWDATQPSSKVMEMMLIGSLLP